MSWGGGTSCRGRTAPAHSVPIGRWWLLSVPLRRRSRSGLDVDSCQRTEAPWSVLCCCVASPSTPCPLMERQTQHGGKQSLQVITQTKKYHVCERKCGTLCVTCHVTIDELRIDGAAAIHVNVIMSWCVAFVFVRFTWLLVYRCEKTIVSYKLN